MPVSSQPPALLFHALCSSLGSDPAAPSLPLSLLPSLPLSLPGILVGLGLILVGGVDEQLLAVQAAPT